MSYIIKSTSPFVSIKLTQAGRESLAKGQLNFASWAIGDSEINYDREAIVDANQSNPVLSGSSKVFRPFEKQPDFKSFITTTSGNQFNPLNSSSISVVKAVVNNEAETRGFFTGSSSVYTTLSGSPYMRGYTNPLNTSITGGTQLVVSSGITINVGDILRLKLTNNTVTGVTALENDKPLPNLFYKVQATGVTAGGTLVTVDRNLPNNSAQNTSNSFLFVLPGGEVADAFGYETATAYWDSGTLSFDSATNITCGDVKVWNQNNVWCENLAGVTGLSTTNLYEDYTKFGSYDYLGSKNPYFEYLCTSNDTTAAATECNGPGFSYPDTVSKSIAILHYTNNTISNLYGDFLYIDTSNSKQVIITMPDLMYHRRNFATASGTSMGMSFISSGTTKLLGTTNIEYMDMYEDPNLISDQNPQVIGKVFPQLKLVVIDNDEIVAATSYKANRNWTLPPLSAFLQAASGGTSAGVLGVNQTIYLTYALENSNGVGLTTPLPCQSYVKVSNTSSSSKDVAFNISDVDLLPYMRKTESGWDGLGFFARQFKLVYQIVDDANTRPNPGAWKTYDYTSTLITSGAGQTIDPKLLENQAPSAIGFVLNNFVNTAATTFDITVPLNLATNASPDSLQFGDERFFYGNLDTFIGATIYKTIIDIRVNASQYTLTTNPTRSKQASTNPPNIKITEVGIYDSNNNLVIVGKVSEPIALYGGNTIMLELSVDF